MRFIWVLLPALFASPALSQRFMDCAILERVSNPPDNSVWSYSAEIVGDRIRTIISQRQGAGTVATTLEPSPVRAGTSLWFELYPSNGVEAAEAVFIETNRQADGTYLVEEWGLRGRPQRREFQRIRLRCPAAPR